VIDFRKSLWNEKQKVGEGKADTWEHGWMDGIRYSMEKYGLRVEDTTNIEERFFSMNSCLYCLTD
jgi:hypothetical protein